MHIISGNTVMNPGNLDGALADIVAMDDFIYSEPLAVPEPALSLLLVSGGVALVARRKTKR